MRSSKPTVKRNEIDQAAITSFIEDADKGSEPDTVLPWEAASVRQDVTKVFNLRLPEDLYLKLKYLSDNQRRRSMQTICMDAIEPMIEAEIKTVLDKKK
jgi:predicted transcriptional regulator